MNKGIKKPKKSQDSEIPLGTKILFSYSIRHFKYSDKIRFYYALKGRDGKSGILSKPGITQVAKTVLLVPPSLDREFQEFFQHWKIPFTVWEIQEVQDESTTKALFSYTLSNLSYKDKVRFYYALKGRDGISGILAMPGIQQLAKSVLLTSFPKELEAFLKLWNCPYKKKLIEVKHE